MLLCVAVAAAVLPDFLLIAAIVTLGVSCLPLVERIYRRRIETEGQEKAIIVYSRFVIAIQFVGLTTFRMLVEHGYLPKMPVESTLIILTIIFTTSFYRHVQSIPTRYRCAMGCLFVGMCATNQWSAIGRNLEQLLVMFAVVLGELLGRSVSASRLEANLINQLNTEKALRTADSRLNHIIKGHCGAALTTLMVVDQLEQPSGTQAPGQQPGCEQVSRTRQLLDDCKRHLVEAIDWCHRRQSFVLIEKGEYRSSLAPCNILDLLRCVLIGVDAELVVDSKLSDQAQWRVDEFVLRLILDESLANARAYAEPGGRLEVSAALVQPTPAPTDAVRHGDGSRCDSVLHLGLSIDSINRPGLPPLTAKQCEQVFDQGYIAHMVSPTSDGLGLDSIAKAVRAICGSASLSTYMDARGRDHTVLHASLPVYEVCVSTEPSDIVSPPESLLNMPTASSSAVTHPSMTSSPLPVPSAAPQHQPRAPVAQPSDGDARHGAREGHHQNHEAPTGMLHARIAGGDREAGATPSSDTTPLYGSDDGTAAGRRPRLRCVGIDDCALQRALFNEIFEHVLHADMSVSGAVGGTHEEQVGFVDYVLGNVDSCMCKLEAADVLRPADVVLVDQNIVRVHDGIQQPAAGTGRSMEHPAIKNQMLYGTDLIQKLRRAGFLGIACLYTSLGADEEDKFSSVSGIDLVINKGSGLKPFVTQLQALLAERHIGQYFG